MSFLARVGSALSSLSSPDTKAPQVGHESFTGSRFVVMALAVLGLLWAPKFGIGSDLIGYGFWLVLAYLASNTITRSIQILVNGRILQAAQELAYRDGTLTETERQHLKDAGTEKK